MTDNMKTFIRTLIEAVVVALTAICSVFFSSSCVLTNTGSMETDNSGAIEIVVEVTDDGEF